jgi:hypothetical protein
LKLCGPTFTGSRSYAPDQPEPIEPIPEIDEVEPELPQMAAAGAGDLRVDQLGLF